MSLYDTLQKTKKELPYRFQRLQAEADAKRSEPVPYREKDTQNSREVSRDQGIRDSYRQRVENDRNTALASMGNQGVPTGKTLIEKATGGLGQAGTIPQQKSVRQYLGLDPTEQQEETPKPKSTLELLEQQREENAKKITEGVLPEKQTASFLTWLDSKAGQVNRGVTKAIDVVANAIPMLEGAIMGENPDSTLTGQLLKPLTDATGKLDEWTARETENATKLVDEAIGDNKALRLASDVGGGVITALPNAALAMMTGGASAGGTIGSQLAPQASGLAGTVSAAWQKLISNPMFQTSFIQGLGSGYEEAKEAGASDVNAMAAALLSTTANSIVEVGGGVETLPGELQNADLSTGKKALQWLTSALDEGKEEVVQGAISSMVNKAASGSDTPYFSMTDENAVVNPLRMGQEFGMGAAVGGILGGGQVLANSMLQKAYANRSGNVQDEATPSQALPDSPLGEWAQGDGIGKLDAAIQKIFDDNNKKLNIDNTESQAYNGINENGGALDGRNNQLDGASGEGVRTGRGGSWTDSGSQDGRRFGQDDLSVPGIVLLSPEAQQTLTERGIVNVELHDSSMDNTAFSAALDAARVADSQNGWAVTPKDANELTEAGTRTFLDRNGSAGFAIATDGDIEAVFANKTAGAPKGATKSTIPQAIANGGTKLDCYGHGLVRLYGRYGFIPVARVTFNPEYANPGWTADKGMPDIYFMMHNGDSADTVVQNMGKYKTWSKAELEALPLMEYDEAYKYRDSLMNSGNGGIWKLDAAIQETLKPTQELENLNNAIDGLFEQNKTANEDTGAESTNVNTNPAIQTPQEQAVDALFPGMDGNSDVMDHGAVGAAESGFSPYSHFQNQTDNFLPEGANAARPVDMPAVDPTGKPVRRGAKTIYGAQTTSDARAEQMENEFMEGMYGYDPVRDKPTLEKAKQTIAQEGYDQAYARVKERLQSMKKLKETGLEAYLLYADAVKNGNDADAAELCLLLTQSGTEFGQGVQLFSMFRKLSPEGQLMGVERLVQRINDKYGDSKKLNGHEISIDENLISEFRNAQDQDTRDAVMEKIYENIGKQIPTTLSEAINQWRYTAMLLNPSTHIKNMGGNLSMMAMKLGKDAIGTGIEAAANKITGGKVGRTKSILNVFNKSDQALMQKAWSDFENVQDDVAGIGKNKDNVMGKIGEYRDYWKLNDPQGNAARLVDGVLRTAEKVPKFNSAMMEAEDMIFSRPDYAVSLAGYMKANKLTEITPEARAYAIKEAQKATFRDANAVSNFVRKIGTGDSKFWNWIGNAIFPFKGTPANVGVRAVEYSPAGLLKAIFVDSIRLKRGNITATEFIDNLSSGLTGSALAAVGYFLAQAGFLRATGVGDEKEKEQQRQQGYKDNSFTLFGHSIPENVFTSASAPMFVGAAFYEALATKALTGEIYSWDEVLQVLAATADPILGQTMLDGLSDTFYTIRSAQGGIGEVTAALLANTAGNYLSSLMPTVLSRISSASDSVGRETYADKNKQLAGIQKEVQGLMMKTPARQMLHEKVDNYGRVQETWNPFGDDNAAEKSLNFLTNVVTPTYPSKIKDTPVENELNRLYRSGADTSDKKIFQTEAAKSFKVDGKTINLTADQHEEFEKIRGENTIEYQGALQDSEQYNNLDDSLKIYATDKMYDFIEQTSKDLLGIGYDPADWVAELKGKSNEEIADAVIKKTIDSYAQSDNFSGKYDGITSMLDSGTIDAAMAVSMLPKEASDGYYNYIQGSGVELGTYIDLYQFKNNAKSDKDKDGKTIKSAQEKVIEYINKVGKGPGQKRRMFLAMGYSEKNLPEGW